MAPLNCFGALCFTYDYGYFALGLSIFTILASLKYLCTLYNITNKYIYFYVKISIFYYFNLLNENE